VTGDPGDPITEGASYSYDVAAGDQLSVGSGPELRAIGVTVDGANGDTWSVEFAVGLDEQLTVGNYPHAYYPSPGGTVLEVHGNGRQCGYERETFQSGSFEITDLSFGPGGYVERLDVTFEQHCNGGEPALRGRAVINNPPPPTALELGVTAATDGVVSKPGGKATVHGTVVCSEDATVNVTGQVTQVQKKATVSGPFSTSVDCIAGRTAPWSATAGPTGTTPFQEGRAEVTGSASAPDPNYPSEAASADLAPTTVTLAKAPPKVQPPHPPHPPKPPHK
jgi:hypothetical protein